MFIGLLHVGFFCWQSPNTSSCTIPCMYHATSARILHVITPMTKRFMWQGQVGVESNLGGKDITHNNTYVSPFHVSHSLSEHSGAVSEQIWDHYSHFILPTPPTMHVCILIQGSAGSP
jgi:hypothetical protein